MNKKIITILTSLAMGTTIFLPIVNANAAVITPTSTTKTSFVLSNPGDETFIVPNSKIFELMEQNGVNVKEILTATEYNAALKEDHLRSGSNWLHKYTYKGHKRITVGVNSAIMKLMKYGGKGGTYAIQALLLGYGISMDPQAASGIRSTLSTINSSKGHWWHIDLKTFKVVAHGVQ